MLLFNNVENIISDIQLYRRKNNKKHQHKWKRFKKLF